MGRYLVYLNQNKIKNIFHYALDDYVYYWSVVVGSSKIYIYIIVVGLKKSEQNRMNGGNVLYTKNFMFVADYALTTSILGCFFQHVGLYIFFLFCVFKDQICDVTLETQSLIHRKYGLDWSTYHSSFSVDLSAFWYTKQLYNSHYIV